MFEIVKSGAKVYTGLIFRSQYLIYNNLISNLKWQITLVNALELQMEHASNFDAAN